MWRSKLDLLLMIPSCNKLLSLSLCSSQPKCCLLQQLAPNSPPILPSSVMYCLKIASQQFCMHTCSPAWQHVNRAPSPQSNFANPPLPRPSSFVYILHFVFVRYYFMVRLFFSAQSSLPRDKSASSLSLPWRHSDVKIADSCL